MKHALAALTLALAGCLATPAGDEPALTAFTASYATGRGHILLELGAAKAVLDADGRLTDAYPLSIRYEGAGFPPDHVVYWLSSDLRVVRVDDVCRREPCPAPYNEVSWALRGAWPPLGLAMPGLVERGERQVVWGLEYDPGVTVHADGHKAVLELRPRDNLTDAAKPYGNGGSEWRQYAYDGRPLPVELRNRVATTRLVEWTPGPPLSGADPLPELEARPRHRGAGHWFEGSGQRLLGANVSFDEAVANASARDPALAQAMAGCFQAAFLGRPHAASSLGTATLPLYRTTETPFDAFTRPAPGQAATRWSWEYQEPSLGDPGWTLVRRGPEEAGPSCSPGPSALPVADGLEEHLARTAELPMARAPVAHAFVFLSRGHGLFGREHPGMQVAYWTVFQPPEGQAVAPVAEEAAELGVWLTMAASTQDLDALPGAYGLSAE